MTDSIPNKQMLCQDCLRIRPFTQVGHEWKELCECGGKFCGCWVCVELIRRMQAKEHECPSCGEKCDCEVGGCCVHRCPTAYSRYSPAIAAYHREPRQKPLCPDEKSPVKPLIYWL